MHLPCLCCSRVRRRCRSRGGHSRDAARSVHRRPLHLGQRHPARRRATPGGGGRGGFPPPRPPGGGFNLGALLPIALIIAFPGFFFGLFNTFFLAALILPPLLSFGFPEGTSDLGAVSAVRPARRRPHGQGFTRAVCGSRYPCAGRGASGPSTRTARRPAGRRRQGRAPCHARILRGHLRPA